ncbi:MAG: crossover junction endodeoxyribonuclease RuvC [bacterium]|nr:MAG: crossover junction endodeoxyribonuclease RuvC [bacterium]
MLVLGIDPGSRVAGWGLVDDGNGRLTEVDSGCIKTPATTELAPRLKYLFNEFSKIIEKYRPDETAVENVFFAKNAKSALMLGQARAAAILPGLLAGLPLHEYGALQVKKALVGNGMADKNQVADMVCRLLGMKEKPSPLDVTDALAVAICHVHSSSVMKRIPAL